LGEKITPISIKLTTEWPEQAQATQGKTYTILEWNASGDYWNQKAGVTILNDKNEKSGFTFTLDNPIGVLLDAQGKEILIESDFKKDLQGKMLDTDEILDALECIELDAEELNKNAEEIARLSKATITALKSGEKNTAISTLVKIVRILPEVKEHSLPHLLTSFGEFQEAVKDD